MLRSLSWKARSRSNSKTVCLKRMLLSTNTNSQAHSSASYNNQQQQKQASDNNTRPPWETNAYYGNTDPPGSFYSIGRGKAIHQYGAPATIRAVAEGLQDVKNRQAAIREIGPCRRVFLLDSYLSADTCEGLAYRLDKLKHNPFMNSILIATDGSDDSDALPRMIHQMDPNYNYEDHITIPPGSTHHVAGGYDPLLIKDTKDAERTLTQLTQLAMAIRGADPHKCKIPILFLPHGAVTDGGAAFFLSSYVLATPDTSYQILHPRRGLSLDPTGLSWWLPRVGQEFGQDDATQFAAGCALILALTGYRATAEDLVDIGLATHLVPDAEHTVPSLERHLMDTVPWNQQAIIKEPKKYEGDFQKAQNRYGIYADHYDHNADFRNVQIANIVDSIAEYSADGVDILSQENDDLAWDIADPSLEPEDPLAELELRDSPLITLARTFHDIFFQSGSVQEIHALLSEVANSATSTQITPQKAAAAKDMVARMDLASPLALTCTYQLLKMGNGRHETLESCMAREFRVQQKFLTDEKVSRDYQAWKRAQHKAGTNEVVQGVQWQDKSLKHVSWDQMVNIIES